VKKHDRRRLDQYDRRVADSFRSWREAARNVVICVIYALVTGDS